MNFFKKHKILIVYGLLLGLLVMLLKLIEYRLVIIDHSFEIYIGSIALLFTVLGIWMSTKLLQTKTKVTIIEKEKIIEKPVFIDVSKPFVLNKAALAETELSDREMEVLQLIAKGLSNREIADNLFVSVNTIKTHIANLFFKLEVSRRTQAIEKAKRLCIIP